VEQSFSIIASFLGGAKFYYCFGFGFGFGFKNKIK
jgi:hypothetical protein